MFIHLSYVIILGTCEHWKTRFGEFINVNLNGDMSFNKDYSDKFSGTTGI